MLDPYAGDHRLLGETLDVHGCAQVYKIRLRALELTLRLERLELDVGVRELDEHAVALHPGSRLYQDALHKPGRRCSHPANLLWNQSPGTTHLA